MGKVRERFLLDTRADGDIIAWLKAKAEAGDKSASIREACRLLMQIEQGDAPQAAQPTGDMAKIEGYLARIATGIEALADGRSGQPRPEPEEDPALGLKIDGLGL